MSADFRFFAAMSMLDLVKKKIQKWTERKLRIRLETDLVPTERIGTEYGGWIIPKAWLTADSVVYSVGAGEDISFDAGLAQKYGCTVHIIDPTPRAEVHFKAVIQGIRTAKPAPLKTNPTGQYPTFDASTADLMRFHPFGLWNEESLIKFYKPINEAHVSHSIVNLQKSGDYVEMPVRKTKNVMAELGHQRIDLMKIDIEGAEYTVLEDILSDNINVRALCIEYDERAGNNIDKQYQSRIENSLNALCAAGFHIIAKEPTEHNYTLVRLN